MEKCLFSKQYQKSNPKTRQISKNLTLNERTQNCQQQQQLFNQPITPFNINTTQSTLSYPKYQMHHSSKQFHNQSNFMLTPQQLLKSSKISRTMNESWVQDLDPLLQGNMKVIYTKIIPVEIRHVDQQGKQVGVKEMLCFRFFIRENADSQYTQLHMQINNDSDLFFVYLCKMDQKKFDKLKKQQGINFPFSNLLSMLVKQLQLCDKQINQYAALFYLNPNSNPRLDFIQNIEYKRIELISFEFEELPEELLKDYITYRFTKLKKNNELIVTKIKTIISEVKVKNPKLLKSILDKKETGKGI